MVDKADRLPGEREHATTGARLAFSLALFLALVVGANALAIRRSPWSNRTYDGMTVETKWELASKGAPDDGIVVIGDSSGNFAVVTDDLEAATGREARNLCTYGRFLVMGAGWFLDRALESGSGTPSVVLVVIGSRTFALEADGFTLAQVPVEFGGWDSRVPGVGLGLRDAAQAAAARVFPLFAQNKSFERAIRKGVWQIRREVMVIEPDGSAILPFAYPGGVAPFADKTVGEMESVAGPVPSERDRAAIEGLIEDATQRGYDVVFVDGPIWGGLAEREEHASFLARAHAFVDEACATSERAWHLPGGLQTFEAAVMENPYHLTRDAALVYTRELARRLRELGLPRQQ